MAPPTGPRNATTTTSTRTTRISSGGHVATRGGTMRGGSTRGGIRKRGSVRVDRDGDLMMDGQPPKPPTGPRGGSKSRGTTSSGRQRSTAIAAHKLQRQIGSSGDTNLASRLEQGTRGIGARNKKIMKVIGLGASKAATNADRGLKSVLEFLERKSLNVGKGFTVIKSNIDADHNLFLMVNEDDVAEVLKLDTFSFAGSALSITESFEPWPEKPAPKGSTKLSDESRQRKVQLQEVLGKRYLEGAKLLNLSKLGEDPILIGMGYLEDKDRAEKTFKVLMAICDEVFPTADIKRDAVHSISLAGNNIDRVTQVFDVATTFPKLLHLDLSGNQFKTLRTMHPWRGKFRQLETLVLKGNPVEKEEPNYKEDIMKWFPYLVTLNEEMVRTPEAVAAEKAAAAAGPQPIPQAGTDFRDVEQIGENFVRQFFPLYDNDKNQLVSLFYDDATTFSLSVSTHTPRKNSDTPNAPWAAYLKYSRNLSQITSLGARIQRLFKGAQVIKELWNSLPATRHPDLNTETGKYIIDCHPVPGLADPAKQSRSGVDGLIISIHGEFDESGPDGKINKRSFTRTFVLGPGAPGQNPILVVSDMLSLRAHSPVPQQLLQQPAPSATEFPPELKQQMVEELSKQTTLKPEFSEMCLSEVGWKFDLALANFNALKPNLGPEMFITMAMPTA